ncbi:MAG: histidinol-phosphate transaminase [Clostridia bacterium]|nr:histidinol-phosphate transaminase [Clostridia bacterium]
MSRFFSEKYDMLVPYVPGEQPKDMQYVKLNTNESPFPPCEKAAEYACKAAKRLQLYSDPECRDLTKTAAEYFGIDKDEIIFTNGSDEILNFAFMAFCDKNIPAAFPDITYGFYPVFAQLNGVPYEEIPLKDDFSINIEDYFGIEKTVFIANPNAPTGIALSVGEIEQIVKNNPGNVVVIDEAYVDFGAESAVRLIHKYDNLLVVQTYSKSRSMAGARLGFGIGCKELIRDLNTVKYSTNPYNINSMTMAAGIGALEDGEYFRKCCDEIIKNREWTTEQLKKLGFIMTDSSANFVFARHPNVDGKEIYLTLKQKGILVRHFDKERLKQYNRITIGSAEQMRILTEALKEIPGVIK